MGKYSQFLFYYNFANTVNLAFVSTYFCNSDSVFPNILKEIYDFINSKIIGQCCN